MTPLLPARATRTLRNLRKKKRLRLRKKGSDPPTPGRGGATVFANVSQPKGAGAEFGALCKSAAATPTAGDALVWYATRPEAVGCFLFCYPVSSGAFRSSGEVTNICSHTNY